MPAKAVFSTREAAKRLKIHPDHLLRLLRQGVLKPSQTLRVGKSQLYCWTLADIEAARTILSKRKPGPKGPHKHGR